MADKELDFLADQLGDNVTSSSFSSSEMTSYIDDEAISPDSFLGNLGEGMATGIGNLFNIPSALGGAWDYLQDAGARGKVPDLKDQQEGASILDILGSGYERFMPFGKRSLPGVIARDVGNKIYEDPRSAIGGLGRTAAETSAAMLSVPIPPAIPGAMAGAGTLTDWLQGTLPEGKSFWEVLPERFGEYYTGGLVGDTIWRPIKGLKKGIETIRTQHDRAHRIPGARRLTSGAATAGHLGFPENRSPKELALTGQLADAAEYVDKSGMWDNVGDFDYNTGKFLPGPVETEVTLRTVWQNLKKQVGRIGKEIKATINNLDDAAKEYNKVSRTSIKGVRYTDLPLDDLRETARRLDETFLTRGSSKEIKGILDEIQVDFKEFGLPDGPWEKSGYFRKYFVHESQEFGLKNLNDQLQNIYRMQRALKEFDVSLAARAALDPSAMAKHGALKESLDALAESYRQKIGEKSLEIVTKVKDGIAHPDSLLKRLPNKESIIAVEGYNPSRVTDLNKAYHSFKPYDEYGLPRAIGHADEYAAAKGPKEVEPFLAKGIQGGIQDLFWRIWRGKEAVSERFLSTSLKRLQEGALGRVSSKWPGPPSTFMDVFEGFRGLPHEAAMITPIVLTKLPRDIGALLSTPEENLPPEIANNADFQALRDEAPNIPPEQITQRVSDLITNNPELANKFIEQPADRGYNIVMDTEGNEFLYDPAQIISYTEKIKREDPNPITRAKKLDALNKHNKILRLGPVVGVKPDRGELKPTNIVDMGNGVKRQEPNY